ncbi:NAD(P)-dependent oxidoreductase [Pedobacter frigiditerrae]|uniref:NAD(P)-dependent oxidoreductase n=1 Tax=Pedobacter frigiditerrae TaxID=2530452 RepID=A0A4R0N032_9SPHI|nr:NAD(P)-dependent oxidoreductase [Pedobacter frigiditerrae]TCC91624.1 NAD(P)-dependent oxidoreductase [Pedobacter frigiditerrae]
MNTTKIGFIGLGKMGIPMAQNLIKASYELFVYNRSIAKADSLVAEGARFMNNPADLQKQCEVVILMVADDKATKDIITGENGLISSATVGKIIINMSTVSPAISKEMTSLLAQEGAFYIDAPVSGSLKQAIEGSLVIMVGGDKSAFEKVKPIFDVLGKLALHIGQIGAGNSAKLAINTLLSFHAQGLAEAVSFAKQQGIDTKDLLELINNSALGNVFMKIKGDAILEDNYNAVFALKHISKDLGLAKAEGLNSPLANAAYESFKNAEQELGEEDIIAIVKKV